MTKKEKQHLELIVYRMDEADKRVESLQKNSKPIYKNYIQISNLSKKIYSIPKQSLWAETKQNTAFRKTRLCAEL